MPKGYIVKAEYHDGTQIELLVPPYKVKAEAEALAKQWRASDLCRDAWTVPVDLCDFSAMTVPEPVDMPEGPALEVETFTLTGYLERVTIKAERPEA